MGTERVYDKINYQTNFTSTSTFAILLKAINDKGEVESEYARTTLFPNARSNAGMRYDPSNRDTHGEISLAQYGLITYTSEKTFKLSSLGKRFLELFNDDFTPKTNSDYNYVSTMIDALFAWKDQKYGRNINVGVILAKLLKCKELKNYISAEEWSFISEFSNIKSDSDFERVKNEIITNRDSKTMFPLKKADVFLGGLAGSWKILKKANVAGEIRYSLSDIANEIIDEKLLQIKTIEKNIHQKHAILDEKQEPTFNDLIILLKNFYDEKRDNGIRLFGIKYGKIIKNNNYKLSDLIQHAHIPESYNAELSKGIKLSDYVTANDELIFELTKEKKSDIEKLDIEKLILEKYKTLDFSNMENEIGLLYKEFQDKFSPDVLFKVNDNDLPRYMFYSETKNKTNMCYYLEKNPKIIDYFGRVGIYSSFAYNLHYNAKYEQWVTGTGKNPILLNYNEAIEKAKEIRQQLSDACSIVKKYLNTGNIADYKAMSDEINKKCDSICNYQWFIKYLHMIYPDMFTTFYSETWHNFLLRKCELPNHGTIYERSGEISLLSKRVNIKNAILAKVLTELFGFPDDEVELDIGGKIEMRERKPRTVKIFGLNTILYGAPGTGKTYSTTEYAVAMIENRKIRENISPEERESLKQTYRNLVKQGQIVFTTFHQSYGYEDFVQGLRPHPVDGNIQFNYENGVFKEIADRAREDQTNNYVIIIDEINRGNISKVFGELITLIEDDKRWGEENQLSALLPSQDEFVVPNNLYILGTMNSADKSISLIDTALRRRFDFIEVAPDPELIKDDVLKNVLLKLNATLRKVKDSSDLLIGHAYFMHKTKDDLVDIMNKNIIPLLYEYCYDNENKINDIVTKALDGTGISIDQENKQGRIRVK